MSSARAKKYAARNPIGIAPLIGLSAAPEWLSGEQRLEWARIIENAPPDVLKRIDSPIVAAFVVAADLFRQATVLLNKSALLIKGRHGNEPVANPLLRIQRGQALVMFKAAEQLGFSPIARARLRGDAPVVDHGGWADIS